MKMSRVGGINSKKMEGCAREGSQSRIKIGYKYILCLGAVGSEKG